MKKYLLVFAFAFQLLQVFANGGEVDANFLRVEYYKCVSSASKTNELYDKLTLLRSDKPLITGFIGALEALKAKHAWNPYTKMAYLAKATSTLAKAISADPQNIEIRFLRYTIEYYVPPFLGYSTHVAEDKGVIIRNISSCRYSRNDVFLVQNIIKFLTENKECAASELALMQNAMKQCSPTY